MNVKEQREERRLAKEAAERERTAGLREFERIAARRVLGESAGDVSALLICGVDEAGRGPLAGPVAAGACVMRPGQEILWLNDSKKLSEKKREELYEVITCEALAWGVGLVSAQRIDEINILQATYEAMRAAVRSVCVMLEEKGAGTQPDVLVNDAVTIPGITIAQAPVVKADAKCLSVAAASILAKVTRDRLMRTYDEMYPAYGFAKHKGYGTREHMEAIRQNGPCPIHRRTFITRI